MLSKIEEYQQLAVRTLRQDSQEKMILHCTMGMVGEIGEFIEQRVGDHDKRKMELGDCMWYAANLCEIMGLRIEEFIETAQARDRSMIYSVEFGDLPPDFRAVIWSAKLCDFVKKMVFYGKALDVDEINTPLTNYIVAIVDLAYLYSLDMFEVLRANIAKLEARYPNLMFDAMNALNRDHVVEELAAQMAVDGVHLG